MDENSVLSHEDRDIILVVDDDAAIVELIVEVLTDEGYLVVQASDGAQALAAIACHSPVLILLDLLMPGMSGSQLMQQIAAVDHASTPVVLMTASSKDAAPFLGSGSVEYLAKPFTLDNLLACVARYVHAP